MQVEVSSILMSDVDQDNILSFSILFELGLFVSLLFYLIFKVFYLN
jgi:hypothetical protein